MKFLFPDRPSVMGILNVTPDSFSDGGKYQRLDAALQRAQEMVAQGADIVDVGGESTRPGATAVSVDEELHRVIPVVEKLKTELAVSVSVDTSTPEVMSEASKYGVDLINDVRALQKPGALAAAAKSGLPVCLMHMQGQPDTMQEDPRYVDLMQDIETFFTERMAACTAAGISRKLLLLDPGFGFGKLPQHNLRLINELDRFLALGCPLLVGLSRKSTIKKFTGESEQALMVGSAVGAVWAYQRGAKILRVHDVAETRWALTMAQQFLASSQQSDGY